jgi:enoyl-[acyl-carrier-protein] reductase (NADH)
LAASLLGSDAKREAAAERHPLNKVLTAEEVASAAAYLVSEHAAGITGQVLHVDAGMGGVR